MEVNFKNIYQHFEIFCKSTNINPKASYNPLYEAKLMVKDQTEFKSNVLYVGTGSFIKDNEITLINSNFIIIDDLHDFNTDSFINSHYMVFKNSYDLFQLFNELNELFINNAQVINSSNLLLNSFLNNKGLNDIVNQSSEILNNPVIIIDTSFRILANSDTSEIEDSYWKENIKKGYCSYDYISYVRKIKDFKESPNNIKPFSVTCDKSPIERWLTKIFIHGKLFGYIIVLFSNTNIQKEHKELLVLLSNVISKEMEKTVTSKNLNNIDYDNFLRDILDGNIKDSLSLEEISKSYGYKFKNKFILLTFDISKYDDTNKPPRYLSSNLESFLNNKPSIYYKEYVVILYDFNENSFLNEENYSNIKTFLKKNNITSGISKEFCELLCIRKNFDDTIRTIQISKKFKKDCSIYFYEDVQFYDFILETHKTYDFSKLSFEELNILLSYDKENNTSLYQTLYVYLKNNQNIVVSSKELFIHRNTMSYRLKKIITLTNIDFTNEEKMFQFYFYIKTKDFLLL